MALTGWMTAWLCCAGGINHHSLLNMQDARASEGSVGQDSLPSGTLLLGPAITMGTFLGPTITMGTFRTPKPT